MTLTQSQPSHRSFLNPSIAKPIIKMKNVENNKSARFSYPRTPFAPYAEPSNDEIAMTLYK